MEIPPDAIEKVTNPEVYLTPREKTALAVTFKMRPEPARLSPTLEAQLFSLFLNGQDCVKIAQMNPGITLGQIVRARVESQWDLKRFEHVEALLKDARDRLQQTTLESVDFVAAQIAAAHKLYGEKVKRYLQTGNEKDLGGFSIHGWKAYNDAIELLKKLTGQDGTKQKVSGEIVHKHEVTVPAANRALTTVEATSVIKKNLAKKAPSVKKDEEDDE